uniref:Uncharacterized protein n=1 Tax=Lactuca sativa TaxID=4236 RepID=A0A9R1XJ14_LACSA|nr:hypothetical protein LSAT_V11C400209110 [Lactuca sativa]
MEVDHTLDGSLVFKRLYVCFKGVRDGWVEGCRQIIRIDGCCNSPKSQVLLNCILGGDSASWSQTRRVGSQSWSRVRDWTRRVQVWTRRVDVVQWKTLAVRFGKYLRDLMPPLFAFWPTEKDP